MSIDLTLFKDSFRALTISLPTDGRAGCYSAPPGYPTTSAGVYLCQRRSVGSYPEMLENTTCESTNSHRSVGGDKRTFKIPAAFMNL